jgi:hypothetical protein
MGWCDTRAAEVSATGRRQTLRAARETALREQKTAYPQVLQQITPVLLAMITGWDFMPNRLRGLEIDD